MATLKHLATGRVEILASSHRVGRDASAHLCLAGRLVSSDHAVLRWRDAIWTVRDLGSKNGTYVDGRRLEKGESARLAVGTRVAFGKDGDYFEMIDDAAPVIVAYLGDEVRYGDDDGLFLPDEENARVVVYEDGPGRFYARVLDSDEHHETDDIRPVRDGEELALAGVRARLSLPVTAEATWSPDEGPHRLADIGLAFTVSRDEEHVDIAVVTAGGKRVVLRSRAHHHLLLILARERLGDAGNPDLDPAEHGWVFKGDLAGRIGCSANQVNVDMHRAKEQLRREAAVVDSHELFEVRPGPRTVRLAVTWLEM